MAIYSLSTYKTLNLVNKSLSPPLTKSPYINTFISFLKIYFNVIDFYKGTPTGDYSKLELTGDLLLSSLDSFPDSDYATPSPETE